MKWHILIGLAGIGAVVVLLGIMAVNEPARMESFTQSYRSRQIEEGAKLFEDNCRPCHGPQGEGTPLGPALNTESLFNGERLAAVGFSGTLEDYLGGVVAAGRPVPSEGAEAYPQRMPTWSEEFGGPMRIDQIENVVGFIQNWEARVVAEIGPPEISEDLMMGVDITIELPQGDAERGQALVEGILGCAACHTLTDVGSPWTAQDGLPALAPRAAIRIEQADYAGLATTPEEYLIESVVMPNAFIVEGFSQGVMPTDYGERITLQEMADVLDYMLSFR